MTLGEQIDKVIDSLPPVTKIVIAAMLLIQTIAFGTWLGRMASEVRASNKKKKEEKEKSS
jgi:hypothetical protein